MSDTETIEANTETQGLSELDMLKQRAKVMGISHSGNIGVDALRAKIEAKLAGDPEPAEDGANALATDGDETPPAEETRAQIRERLTRDSMRLVRVRITDLDPKKKDLPGEIFTIANEFIGTVKKYVPYGEVTDNGYHLPKIIYDELEARKFLSIRVTKKNGREHVEQNWAKEFAMEVLPQLTENDLARLAASQAAAGGVS